MVILSVMTAPKDYTGLKYGRLTFIHSTDQRTNDNCVIWECLCDCGTTCFRDSKSIRQGNTKSCGCLKREQDKLNGQRTRKHLPHIRTALKVFNSYNDGDIDFDTFFNLSQRDCFYCGRAPYRIANVFKPLPKGLVSDYAKQEGNFTYNGLDRLDSNKGHTLDNVVPCCFECNTAKNSLSVADFKTLIKRIYEHMRLDQT